MDSTAVIPPGLFGRSILMLLVIIGILMVAIYLIMRIKKWYGFFI